MSKSDLVSELRWDFNFRKSDAETLVDQYDKIGKLDLLINMVKTKNFCCNKVDGVE